MEQRLIDAFALISEMEDKCCGDCDLCIYCRYENANYFCGLIETAPTVAVDNYAIGYQDGVRKVFEERKSIYVVSVREEIDGEDVVYHRYFSSERKAENFINDNLKGQIVMSLSEEEVT